MIDWHCHLLPGVDDGPAAMDGAVDLAAALAQAGFTTAYCTPHLIRGSFIADNGTVRKTVAALQAELDLRRIGLRLFPGREYYFDEFLEEYLKDPLPLGDTKFLLIEIPDHIPVEFVKETCFRIKCRGYIPMIAHPERCSLFEKNDSRRGYGLDGLLSYLGSVPGLKGPMRKTRDPALDEAPLLNYLTDLGCAFQGNIGSFAGIYGVRARKSAERLRSGGNITHWGTDLHAMGQIAALLNGRHIRLAGQNY
jgi:protein-tyrosine phosphatase